MKRFRPRAKGRASPIKKPFSRITIVLEEKKLDKKKVHYIKRDKRLGVGNAHNTGILWAYKNKFSIVITMDGDLSHDPAYINEFFRKSLLGYEFILSNRYNKNINTYKNWPFIKKLINKFGRLIIILLFNIKYDIIYYLREDYMFGLEAKVLWLFVFVALYWSYCIYWGINIVWTPSALFD